MKVGKILATVIIVGSLSTALTGVVQGRPSFAINTGNTCKECHANVLTGRMQVGDTGNLVDLGTELSGNVRGPLQTFQVTPGNIVTLSVDVLDGNDKFAVQLKRLEKGGQANNQANVLIWEEANGPANFWTRQELSNPPYFTFDNHHNGGLRGSATPATYTFDLFVDANTPPDFYDLEFAVAGKASGLGKWYQDEHFYIEVLPPVAPADAAAAHGGALYDKWWAVTGADKPTIDHPLWASRPDQTSNTRSGADTWRCKECHGWDYKGVSGAYGGGSHRTGIAGIFGTAKTGQELFDLIKTDHAYGDAGLSDDDIWNLVEFILNGLIDTDTVVDADGAFIGSVPTGKTLYDAGIGTNLGCAVCHGPVGLTPPPGHPEFDEYVGLLSNENPWEFLHKVRFGNPGSAMPSSVAGGGTAQDAADLGAYAQTLPPAPPNPAVVRGGALYDKWWAVTGTDKPTTDHPLWAMRPDETSNKRSGADTWRCKECHGWDYRGVHGIYGGGSHRTGITGIFGTTKTAQELFDLIKTDHAYGTAGLSDDDISDLAEFVLKGLIDTDTIVDADGAFTGSLARGETLYDAGIGANVGCAQCHGPVGLTPPPGHPEFEEYVGLLSNENPWEFQHKVRFGNPGSAMPGSVAGSGTAQDVADLGTYAQTLPAAPPNLAVVRGGALYDKWWAVTDADKPITNHPLWALRPDTSSNTRSGADTWRCKECHGWDYKGVNGAYAGGSHRTGIAGILGTTKTAQELFDLIKTDHAYGSVGLSDESIWDLVEFVVEGLIDTNDVMAADGVFTGDATRGQSLFDTGIGANTGCASCHGRDGLAPPPGATLAFEDFPGMLSNENPWEFLHKVRFGQPSTAMPGSVAGSGTVRDVADLAAYAQTLPQTPLVVPGARGGVLYDKWWAVVGADKPTTDHPLWGARPDMASNTRSGADTWRCKECHGWDYKGVNGAYGAGSHRTGIAGILGTTKSAQALFDLIKTDHAYGTAGLSDDDIWDLVDFVLQGLIDTDAVVGADGAFLGNPNAGQVLYGTGIGVNVGCAACHGPAGLTPPPGHPEFDEYVGLLSNENAWEFLHKVRFGNPGTIMPGSFAGGGTSQDAANLGAYAQTLPEAPAPVQIEFDPDTPQSVLAQGKAIFTDRCGICHSLPTVDAMKAFSTDDALIARVTEMANRANLSAADAEDVIRYLLALRHDVVVAILELNPTQMFAMLAGVLGVGVCVPARRRLHGRPASTPRARRT